MDVSYLEHWVKLGSRVARHSLFVSEENQFVKALESELKQVVSGTSVMRSAMELKDSVQVFGDNEVSMRRGDK